MFNFHVLPTPPDKRIIQPVLRSKPRRLRKSALSPKVFLLPCKTESWNPEECRHSYGIDHTWSRVWVLNQLLSLCSLKRERIALLGKFKAGTPLLGVHIANT
jgi:hypothetical protein